MVEFLKSYNKRYLSQDDFESIGKFLIVYAEYIEPFYGLFNWEEAVFKDYCKNNGIVAKGKKNKERQHNHFWFTAKKPKGRENQDYAHHFLRHIRNSFAHGNFHGKYLGKGHNRFKYYQLRDVDVDKGSSMSGVIRAEYLWEMIRILIATKLDGRP